jgi:predicted O-methyltransferase YrrM
VSVTRETPRSWFDANARMNFERWLLPWAHRPLSCLQLGVFTGDASVWLMENLPRAVLDDVDPFTGSEKIEHFDYEWVRQVYDRAVAPYQSRCRVHVMRSTDYFCEHPFALFDVIYVDGEHLAPTALSDAVHSFERLTPGGLIAFDDYVWDDDLPPLHTPKPAVDAFCSVYADRLRVIEHGVQVWVQKL